MAAGLGVSLSGVVCRFSRATVLDGISLSVAPGEFVVILGPSGCGKTTLLRAIAGFQRPEEGEIRIGDRLVSGTGSFIPPEERGLGIVFQSYALWPHMSVAENVGFGLHRHPDRTMRVTEALRLVGLEGFADRRPATLSGGQRQRVALARCLAKSPGVILMDEPLANLDPTLRGAMQAEFTSIHRRTGATFVYVTHDRAEALALADRVVLLMDGRVLQHGSPQAVYERPATPEAARFLGAALLPVALTETCPQGFARVSLNASEWTVRAPANLGPGPALLCLREHDVAIGEGAPATVTDVRYQGSHWLVRVRLPDAIELELVHHGAPPRPGEHVGVAVKDGWVVR